jgi:MOSC domain-containing protein YiiM
MRGVVESIHIAEVEGGPLQPLAEATLVPGRGILGDRYAARGDLHPKQEVTLVAAEQIEAFAAASGLPLAPHETRRNLVTRGIALNELVGRDFRVGAATLRGIQLCEPCRPLGARLAAGTALEPADVVTGLLHRAGLRARILAGGTVRVGDAIDDGTPGTS